MIWKHTTLFAVLMFLFYFSRHTHGLKCRLENDIKTQEDFEQIVKNCMDADGNDSNNRNRNNNRYYSNNNNNNNNRNWNNNRGHDQRNQNSNNRGKYNQNDERDDESNGNNRRRNNSGRRNQQGGYSNKDSGERDYDYEQDNKWHSQDTNSDNRRQPPRKSNNSPTYISYGSSNRRDQKDGSRYSSDSFNKFFNTSRGNTNSNIGSPLEEIEPCVVHCIFRQMKMVSDESYLSRNTVLNVLTRRIKDQELKAFVQESINECFENLDADEEEICDYSKSFAMCIEEKGKTNCDDWEQTAKFGKNNRNKNNNQNNGYSTFQTSRG